MEKPVCHTRGVVVVALIPCDSGAEEVLQRTAVMTTSLDFRTVMRTMSNCGTIPILASTSLPRIKSDLDFNDTTFFAVYCFIRNFIG